VNHTTCAHFIPARVADPKNDKTINSNGARRRRKAGIKKKLKLIKQNLELTLTWVLLLELKWRNDIKSIKSGVLWN